MESKRFVEIAMILERNGISIADFIDFYDEFSNRIVNKISDPVEEPHPTKKRKSNPKKKKRI